jgi:regulator of nonsense transcripts 1
VPKKHPCFKFVVSLSFQFLIISLRSLFKFFLQPQNGAELEDTFANLDFVDHAFPEDQDADDYQPADLPEWACSYCGLHNPASVVKCLSTGKWFCNGRTLSSASCIITHLVKGKFREVSLHKMSPLGETVLECFATGSRNVFALGYVPLKDENTVVLLCRDTVATSPSIKDLNLDMSQWQPLIADRAFVDWLVRHPSEDEMVRSQRLTLDEVSRLEEMWRAGKSQATLADLTFAPAQEEDPLPVALHYEDAAAYESLLGNLIHLEADYDRNTKESQVKENVTVHWSVGLNKRHVARFYFPKDTVDLRLMLGDELRLRHPCPRLGSPAWQAVGIVTRLDDASEEVAVEFRSGAGGGRKGRYKGGGRNMKNEPSSSGPPPVDVSNGFSVEYVWRGTSYERMQVALRSFSVDQTSLSGYLYHSILGHDVEDPSIQQSTSVPKKLSAPGLPELNHSQLEAVQRVLGQPLSLIQGPPGTGKTVTSATIVYHLAKADQGQVLVVAPSNIAVDHLAERISLTGLRVVRLQAKSREEVAGSVESLTLQYQVRNLDIPEAAELRKLQLLREELGELSSADERKHQTLLRHLEREVLHAADVVCCTCVGSGDPRLSKFKFRRVLIDEATQAVEAEALIPLVMGCKQAVLVGDHCQLGPVILNKKAAKAGLSQSLFERLMLLGVRPIRLAVQYRMHPILSSFPSNTFYEGALQNGVSAAERAAPEVAFPWPAPGRPLMFWSQLGAEEISASGTSYLNRTEAAAVEKVVTHLLKCGVLPSQIGIITPYEGQRAHVVAVMARNGPMRQALYAEIEVASVDSFQGREKDYIILSCVRSNEHQGIGFLSDPRRLNVALTRARYGLVVMGNPRVLSKQPVWSALLSHFKEEDALVEGPLTSLKSSIVHLGRARRAFDVGLFALGAAMSNRYRPVENAGERHEGHTGGGGGGGGGGTSGYGMREDGEFNTKKKNFYTPGYGPEYSAKK